MRSGWPHTQEDPGSLASQRQAQYGPMDSWPNGYPALGNGDGEYPYPTHGTDPYAVEQPAAAAPPASPGGEHPYAAFGGPGQGTGIYMVPNLEAFGYGDPGYSDPGYDGPSSQDAGVAGTQTVRGTVESRGGYSGGGPGADQQLDIYHQPWDYNQPLRYDDEDPTWSLLESRDTDTRQQPAAFDPPGYNGSPLSSPGVAVPGYDLSGIIHTGEFPNIDYDQPSYGRLSYDDPRYADFRADDMPQGFDLPMIEEPPSNDTRYDLPALESPPHGTTRFDLPALDSRLDHAWPDREDLPSGPQSLEPGSFDPSSFSSSECQSLEPSSFSSFEPPSGINQTSMDLAADLPKLNQTRYDLPAVDDFQYGDRFTQTSADGMPALPDPEFQPAPVAFHPADVSFQSADVSFQPAGSDLRGPGTGLVAPVDEQPMSWADETSFDRFGDAPSALAPAPAEFSPSEFSSASGEFGPDSGGFAVAPAAFTPASPAFTPEPPAFAPDSEGTGRRTGPRRAVSGKRRGHSRDKREWIALGAIAVVAAGAIGGVLMKFVFSGPSGPQHTVSTPNKVGSFTREPGLEKQMKIDQLRASVIKSSDGKASGVSSGVFQQGESGIGNNPQIYMFVGGKLANSDPQASVTNFEQTYKQGGGHTVAAGSLGGEAACATSTVNGESVSMCVWFDNDTFGEFVSPTMTPAKLAATMNQARPNLEHMAH